MLSALLLAGLAGWLALGRPLCGVRRIGRLLDAVATEPALLVRCYRWTVAGQLGLVTGVAAVAWALGVPPQWNGFAVAGPRLLDRTGPAGDLLLVAATFSAAVAAVALRCSPAARRRIGRVRVLFPTTGQERSAFTVVAVTTGVAEELVYRAFLPLCLLRLVPGLPVAGALLIAAAVFAAAHAYQGPAGVAVSGAAGLVLGWLWLASGGLAVPIAAHVLADLWPLAVPRQRSRLSPRSG